MGEKKKRKEEGEGEEDANPDFEKLPLWSDMSQPKRKEKKGGKEKRQEKEAQSEEVAPYPWR